MKALNIVALTGSTGFIGSTILNDLITHGFHVRVLVRNENKFTRSLPNSVEVIIGDLSNETALSQLIDGAQSLIHSAGRVRGKSYEEFKSDNVDGTKKLIDIAAKSTHLSQFIHISSLAARQPALSNYSRSKHEGELLFTNNPFNKWVIIRPPAVYGPADTEIKPLFDWARRGILWVLGNPRQQFSLLHVEDLSRLVMGLVESNLTSQLILEPDDGYIGNYDWHTIQKITSDYFNSKVRLVTLPSSMLLSTAHLNVLFSKLIHYSPMLTPGKVRELAHDNWCSKTNSTIPQWSPTIDLKKGLSTLYSPK